MDPLVTNSPYGLYCPRGDFYIDPWRSVDRAVITHAHADHARPGSEGYLCSTPCEPLLRRRVGKQSSIESVDYGQSLTRGGVKVSLHPAGHVLGSAQVRIEHGGQVCVVSGDYKVDPGPTCRAFEPIRCDHFISECTFGLPVYRWPNQAQIAKQINAWWRSNIEAGRTSVVGAYALGKAQRVLASVDPAVGPIAAHGAVMRFVEPYRDAGVGLPEIRSVTKQSLKQLKAKALIVAPPSALSTPWIRKFGPRSEALASGWMQVRGRRRHQALDRGFVLSDHADWPGLIQAIQQTGAPRISLTHGLTDPLGRYLHERYSLEVHQLSTQFQGESDDDDDDEHERQTAEPT